MVIELTFENKAGIRRRAQFNVPYLTLERFIADTGKGLLSVIELVREANEILIGIKDLDL